jgi:hypothetical protein
MVFFFVREIEWVKRKTPLGTKPAGACNLYPISTSKSRFPGKAGQNSRPEFRPDINLLLHRGV